jgi:16S rRNA (cytosine967-C5)-methyltransferase
MNSNYRQFALQGLVELMQDKPLPSSFLDWPPAAKHLLLQTCRYFHRLEAIANVLISKNPKDSLVIAVIILGLCELHMLEKPEHAVINEMVNLVKKNKFHSAAGFTNAILRKSIREKNGWEQKLSQNDAFIYSHPLWFINTIQKAWPNDWQMILSENNQHPPMTLRVNQAKIQRADYLKKITAKATLISPQGIILQEAQGIENLYGFSEGYVSVQDEAAQLAVLLLDIQGHQRILDACAAPGGKTSHILETSHPETCVAIEVQEKRFEKLKKTFERLNLNPTCLLADASSPETWWDGNSFDRILIDAPCSGTGVIRRHPDIKLRRSEKNIYINLDIQKKLLQNLWPLLKPNGILVYATCSVLPEENEQQIEQFLQTHLNAQVQDIKISIGKKCQHGLQILPGTENMDGFYYCVLKKIEC